MNLHTVSCESNVHTLNRIGVPECFVSTLNPRYVPSPQLFLFPPQEQ